MCDFALFAPPGAAHFSHETLSFPFQIAKPWFRELRKLKRSVCAFPRSVFSRTPKHTHTLWARFHFSRNRGFAIWSGNTKVSCENRIPRRLQKVKIQLLFCGGMARFANPGARKTYVMRTEPFPHRKHMWFCTLWGCRGSQFSHETLLFLLQIVKPWFPGMRNLKRSVCAFSRFVFSRNRETHIRYVSGSAFHGIILFAIWNVNNKVSCENWIPRRLQKVRNHISFFW